MRTTLSKTRQELLNSTVQHFNCNNRAVNGSVCSYLTKEGKRCAIGRELTKKKAQLLDSRASTGSGTGVTAEGVFELLPKRLRDMGKHFLSDIQSLHDDRSNWNETGLSYEGKGTVRSICETYDLENPIVKE